MIITSENEAVVTDGLLYCYSKRALELGQPLDESESQLQRQAFKIRVEQGQNLFVLLKTQ